MCGGVVIVCCVFVAVVVCCCCVNEVVDVCCALLVSGFVAADVVVGVAVVRGCSVFFVTCIIVGFVGVGCFLGRLLSIAAADCCWCSLLRFVVRCVLVSASAVCCCCLRLLDVWFCGVLRCVAVSC